MLSLATRRMTDSERGELGGKRARIVAAHARRAEELRRAKIGGGRAMLWIVGAFALIAAFNVYAGHFDTAAIAGAGTAMFLGVAAWLRFGGAPVPVEAPPEVARLDAALARDEVRVIEIRADAAVTVQAVEGEGERRPVADLLRAGEQVICVSRALCPDGEAGRWPNTHVRILGVRGLGVRRVEGLGERVEPLAVVDGAADDRRWGEATEAIVWTPGTGGEVLDLEEGERYPDSVDLADLAGALVSGAR